MKKLKLFQIDNKTKIHSRRNDRIASQMRECFSKSLIRGDLYDIPCHTIITITHIDLSPNLRNAKVFVIPLGGAQSEETIAYLEKNKHYFKNIIATKMKMRFIPEITFKIDASFEYVSKIDKLLFSK